MFLDTLDKIIRFISKYIVLAIIMIIGFSMLLITWAHVYYRYVMNDSLTWSEELLKILIVWFCLLSASFISVRREHVSIVIFKQMFPKKLEKVADYAVSFIMFAATAVMMYIGWKFTMQAGMRKTPALRLPMMYQRLSVFVAFGVMALYELRNFLADIIDPGRPPALRDESAPLIDAPEFESPDVTQKEAGQIMEAVRQE